MARKVQTVESFADDVDGSAAAETISFNVDGVSYEIDLSKRNAKAIRGDFDKWVTYARKVTRSRTRAKRPARGRGAVDAAAVRAWAAENGIEVSSRGRIPAAVLEQYQAG